MLAVRLAKFGISVMFVDATKPQAFAASIRPDTRAVYAEILGNPSPVVLDTATLAAERGRRVTGGLRPVAGFRLPFGNLPRAGVVRPRRAGFSSQRPRQRCWRPRALGDRTPSVKGGRSAQRPAPEGMAGAGHPTPLVAIRRTRRRAWRCARPPCLVRPCTPQRRRPDGPQDCGSCRADRGSLIRCEKRLPLRLIPHLCATSPLSQGHRWDTSAPMFSTPPTAALRRA